MGFPVYCLNPALAFPELRQVIVKGHPRTQSTQDSPRPAAALSLALAHLLQGQQFEGESGRLSIEKVNEEITEECKKLNVDVNRLISWADSICIPPDKTFTNEEIEKFIPRTLPSKLLDNGEIMVVDEYQRREAAWSAFRMGSVLALECGVGKSPSSCTAAIGAVQARRCSNERCFIICPLNAVGQWQPYTIELKKFYKEVAVVTVDSLHQLAGLNRAPGGALIIDEAHKIKDPERDRTKEAHQVRLAFEWAVCLTGTLLNAGPEGILSVLDMACPGLSRYFDKWAFGEAFQCIAEKKFKAGGRTRRKKDLVIPPESVHDDLVFYLSRGVRSLDLQSEEVQVVAGVPPNTQELIDTWPRTPWVEEVNQAAGPNSQTEVLSRFSTLAEAYGTEKQFEYEDALEEKIACLIPAETDWRVLIPALATAIMTEDRIKHIQWLNSLSEDEKLFIDDKRKQLPGLPTFADILHTVSKLGWEDLVLRYNENVNTGFETFNGHTEPLKGYLFERPPGHCMANPAPGPKILWTMDWIDKNPTEPIVIGAAAVPTLNLMQAMMIGRRTPYRLIRGGVGNDERTAHIDAFQKGKVRVMLLQQIAGSESVTLTRACTSILIDHSWGSIPYSQFIHRTYRRGQTRPTLHYNLVMGDIQQKIVQRLIKGKNFDDNTRKQLEQETRYNQLAITGGRA